MASIMSKYLLIPIGIALFLTPRHKVTYVEREVCVQKMVSETEFSPDNLIKKLKRMNIRHYKVAYAQAVLETGRFTSSMFARNNNLFGMKVSRQRANTCSGEVMGHAYYRTWEESVVDYALYYNKYLSRMSECELYSYIGRSYAEDSGYVNKLKQIACTVK